MQRSVKGEVVSSTFDEPASRHVQVAEMVIEKAKRLVEHSRDVVILLIRSRASAAPTTPWCRHRQGAHRRRRCQRPAAAEAVPFGAARNIEEGGSLTIIATALIDTGSRMDEVIFEELRAPATRKSSSTARWRTSVRSRRWTSRARARARKRLVAPDQLKKMYILRRILNPMGTMDAIDFLLDKLRNTKSNSDFFESMNA